MSTETRNYEVAVSYNVGPAGARERKYERRIVRAVNVPHAVRLVESDLPAGAVVIGKMHIHTKS